MPSPKEKEIEHKAAQPELLESEDSNEKTTFFLELYRKALSLQKNELNEYFLDYAVQVTKSKIGFFHFVHDNQKTIVLTSWNKQALKNCTANYTAHYSIEKAGNWADSIRLKQPIIYNDFGNSPNQKGLPEGHVRINRLLSFPLIDNGIVIAIFGVGNKDKPYTQDDITQLDLVSTELNKIVKQRQAEADLAASKERYRSLFTNMIDIFVYGQMIYDDVTGEPIDFIILEINDAYARLWGKDKQAIIGKKASEFNPDIQKLDPRVLEIYGNAAETCEKQKEELFFNRFNKWFNVSVYCPAVKGYFAAILEDVTERKKFEEALKESEQLYHTIFDNSEDAFELIQLIYDANGKPIDQVWLKINQAFVKQTGLNEADIATKTAKQILPGIEPYWFEIPDRVLKTGKSTHFENYNKDTKRYYDAYFFPYTKNTVGGLFRDITQRKEMEKQLQIRERMAAIGETAGIVGHDIRNPLQAIISDVYLAKIDLDSIPASDEKSGIVESLEEIEKNANYINEIVADLQDFVRPLAPKYERVDLQKIVNQAICTLDVPSNIKIEQSIDDLNKMITDPAYIQRILTNLCNNAIQAMPNGGSVTITAYSQEGKAIISVEDKGGGIPEEVRAKLFTPLMTTKAKGQGFGLVAVKRFTEALGGTVRFETELGKGTKFILELPKR